MSIFRMFRNSGPRLVPELDDSNLGRVRKQLDTPPMPGLTDIQVDQIERVIQDAGTDWDRRAHRFLVLAESAADSGLARSWRRRQPRSADALIFEAWVELVRGRSAGRMEDAHAAADSCHRAAELQPNDPTPWVVLLGILRLTRCDQQDVFKVWHEVTARDAWHREAHIQMLGYVSPEECGSHGQVLDFVDSVRSRITPAVPAVGLELAAAVDHHNRTVARGGVDALLARRQWTQARAESALARALADWVRAGRLGHAAALADLNMLAYALVQANRLPEAAEVFQLIGGTVTPWPWRLDGDPVQQFSYWQAQALR
ncbi:hypothetical protein [Kitasatospora sp. MAP5-34]|uniref:hypothetical protein n=1 Tax=Kitasatospora sp. MAP5-34 TaxID=3035102 RepID=UPI0024732D27|nr:hypothetical protein [Kitasatospora sp. MAP5-34]MDH6577326.1 uncharacterized protein with PIN domain [Kitasatospora sp. MAP5-34]